MDYLFKLSPELVVVLSAVLAEAPVARRVTDPLVSELQRQISEQQAAASANVVPMQPPGVVPEAKPEAS